MLQLKSTASPISLTSVFVTFMSLCLLASSAIQAATITVDASDGAVDGTDGVCSISEAIQAANTDTAVNECPAGDGDDTINLSNDITLTTTFENDVSFGRTGTPTISSTLVLDGHGFTIQRDGALNCNLNDVSDADEFRILRVSVSGDLSLTHVTLANGCLDDIVFSGFDIKSGGALFNSGELSITDSSFVNNKANDFGSLFNTGTISLINNSTFSGNLTGNGGGLYNEGTIATIQNSTFSDNTSGSFGGGLTSNSVITLIQNSTFSGNTAGSGGGAITDFSFQNINLTNVLFVNNSTNFSNPDCQGALTGSNNLSDNAVSSCPGLLATTLTASTVGPLADNGGPTMTHALLPNSEAIDAGDGNSTTSDQRGINAFGIRDIGAYELNPLVLCPIALQTDGFTATVIDSDELNEAIECANLNGDANGGDTINLGNDITYVDALEDSSTYGRTATPAIMTPLIINGNGFRLERNNSLVCDLNSTGTADEFRIMRVDTFGDLTLNNITVANGCVDDSFFTFFQRFGGAVLNLGTLALTDCTFENNQAGFDGGGVYNDDLISSISNCTFSDNFAGSEGGGINNDGTVVSILNSTFSGNTGESRGGGIINKDNNIDIQNSNFINNSSINAAAILNSSSGTMNLSNSLFLNNLSAIANDCGGSGTGSNNLSDDAASDCPGVLATTLTASTVGALADNGGPTLTHALLPGSEALDIGVNGTASDQRGFTASGIRDIGAFEAQPPMVVAPADVTAVSTGPLTSPALGSATVVDADNPGLVATASQTADFPVGMTTLTWAATDSYGFVGTDTQVINILATVGGSVTGLAAGNSVEIQNNGGDNLVLNSDGSFIFTTPLALNDTYIVTVLTQPMGPEQTCTVSSGSGFISASNITSIVINCATNTYTIGGTVSGLAVGNSVTLQNNAGDDLTVNANGSFTFAKPLPDGTAYTVTISQQPANQTCVVNNGIGALNGSNVNDVEINCADNSISLSSNSLDYGNVDTGRGSTNTVTVTNNGSADVAITDINSPAAPFSITGGSCSGLPVTLAAGGRCEINVLFNPVEEGSFIGSFQIISNASSSPDEVTLSGSSRILTVPTLSQWALMLLSLLVLVVVYKNRLNLY